ncbi:MAG TPA: hypothetical protein VF260_06135 [Bacilli bacterium]
MKKGFIALLSLFMLFILAIPAFASSNTPTSNEKGVTSQEVQALANKYGIELLLSDNSELKP